MLHCFEWFHLVKLETNNYCFYIIHVFFTQVSWSCLVFIFNTVSLLCFLEVWTILYFFRTVSFTSYNLEDGTAKSCNGEMFLNCILEDPKKLSDYDDLADFLECKTGKNYSKWLNGREVYRNRRYQRKIDLRKKKKETFWNSSKYRKIGKSLKRQNICTFMKHWKW